MTNLTFYNRTAKKTEKIELDVDDTETILQIKERLCEKTGSLAHETNLIYCGQLLKDGRSLNSYQLRPGVSFHALRKPEPSTPVEKPEPLDENSKQSVIMALQTTLLNPAYRTAVEKILEDPEAMENIMAATPGLDSDPIAVSMLQDPLLLFLLADPKIIENVIKVHPCLGQAAILIAASVSEGGGAASTPSRRTARQTYSMHEMSDDEEYFGDDGGSSSSGSRANRPSTSGTPGPITASQLAQALAAASTSSSGQSTSQTPMSSGSQGGITPDFFRQAISAALGSDTDSTSSPGPPASTLEGASATADSQDLAAQLQQLKDMGITDENVARQALQATGGNLQAALEILFGDDAFN